MLLDISKLRYTLFSVDIFEQNIKWRDDVNYEDRHTVEKNMFKTYGLNAFYPVSSNDLSVINTDNDQFDKYHILFGEYFTISIVQLDSDRFRDTLTTVDTKGLSLFIRKIQSKLFWQKRYSEKLEEEPKSIFFFSTGYGA